MMVLKLNTEDSDDWVIVRDRQGNKVCEIRVAETGRTWARLAIDAPREVPVNRKSLDRNKYPNDYQEAE